MPGLSDAKSIISAGRDFCLMGEPRFGNPNLWTLPTTAFLVTPNLPPMMLVERPSFQSAISALTRWGVHSSFIIFIGSARRAPLSCPSIRQRKLPFLSDSPYDWLSTYFIYEIFTQWWGNILYIVAQSTCWLLIQGVLDQFSVDKSSKPL